MKKLFILAILALSLSACHNANTNSEKVSKVSVGNDTTKKSTIASADAPIITFERDIFDFGKIKQGDVVSHDFKLKNTGKTPLIISDATATCGCTIPKPPKDPILPGNEAIINVIFNSTGKEGIQDKVITITSNATPNQTTVHLVGEVLYKK